MKQHRTKNQYKQFCLLAAAWEVAQGHKAQSYNCPVSPGHQDSSLSIDSSCMRCKNHVLERIVEIVQHICLEARSET